MWLVDRIMPFSTRVMNCNRQGTERISFVRASDYVITICRTVQLQFITCWVALVHCGWAAFHTQSIDSSKFTKRLDEWTGFRD